jgi:hypothetical protein
VDNRYRRTGTRLALGLAAVLAASRTLAQVPNYPPSKPGFPLVIRNGGTVAYSNPIVADLGLTAGVKSIIFGTVNGDLHVVSKISGVWQEAPGWPQHVGNYIASSPAVGDLDNDGQPEIVVGYGDPATGGPGGVKAYKRNGTLLWSRVSQDRVSGADGLPDPVLGTPAIGDIDGDGLNEVVWGSTDFQIYAVVGATGADKPNWPRPWDQIRDTVRSSPVLHDIDGDGKLDVIIGVDAHAEGPPYNTPDGGCLHVFRYDGSEVPGFPKCVDQVIESPPSVADIDGDGRPEIVHGTGSYYPNGTQAIYAWKCDGTPVPGWPILTDGNSIASPAFANLDADPALEVIVATDNRGPSATDHVYAFKGNGTQLFKTQPRNFFGAPLSISHPVVADVLNAPGTEPEILVPNSTSVAILRKDGVLLTDDGSHPGGSTYALYTDTALSAVAVADFGDGRPLGIVAISGSPFPSATDTKIWVWETLTRTSAAPPWGFFHQNEKRSGVAPSTASCTPVPPQQSFYTIAPCRIVDTRRTAGPLGGPILYANQTRDFALRGACGIPSTARSVSLNVTVTGNNSYGDLRLYPAGASPPTASAINWNYNTTRANNTIVGLGSNGAITAWCVMPLGGTQMILDVNGYFQ